MAFEHQGAGALDYFPCRYGKSKLLFRGPRRNLDQTFCAALGGTETYGKFIQKPWPALVEQRIGVPTINLGYLNAGTDVFVNEPEITEACSKAAVTVVQLMGAQNMSNRFYAVHPRRNDRFLRASSMMQAVFREVDFTEFNFTRHMLHALADRTPDKFALVVDELRAAWVARMKMLLEKIEGKVILLWLGDHRAPGSRDRLGPDPLLVDQAMVDELRPLAAELVRVEPSAAARAAGTAGMHFAAMEEPAAAGMPGPMVHQEVAEAITPVMQRLI